MSRVPEWWRDDYKCPRWVGYVPQVSWPEPRHVAKDCKEFLCLPEAQPTHYAMGLQSRTFHIELGNDGLFYCSEVHHPKLNIGDDHAGYESLSDAKLAVQAYLDKYEI